MMFLSIKKSLLYPQNSYRKTTVCDIGFAEILTAFWSNLYKADTCL